MFRRVLGGLALILAFALGAHGAQAQRANAGTLEKIRFNGARTFPEPLLRAAIISNQSSCRLILCLFGMGRQDERYDAVGLSQDVYRLRLFYYERGYREADIALDTLREGSELTATFQIEEGRPVRVNEVVLNGLDELDDGARRALHQARGRLPLQAGAALSLIDYEFSRDSLLNRLHNLGFAQAQVLGGYQIPRDAPYDATVSYDLYPGERVRFGEPRIEGNELVSDAVIRRMLDFESGDYYSRDAILRSQRNLFGLDVFRNVQVRADVAAADSGIVPIVVEAHEGPVNRLRIGVGLSSAEFGNAEGRWTARNFLGGARRLEVRGRVANVLAGSLADVPLFENAQPPFDVLSGSITVDFTQPWFFDPANTFGAGLLVERRSIPDVFVRTAQGGYVTVSRVLNPGTSVSFAYRPELTRLDAEDLIFCVSFVTCESSAIRVLREPHWLAPLTFSLVQDRSNSLFAPTRGHVFRIDAEYAADGTGSEFSYARLLGELSLYREPFRGLVFASRLRPGWARSMNEPGQGLGLHPQKRFFAGGPNSVRGLAQYRLGPKLLTINAVRDLIAVDSTAAFAGCTALAVNAGTCDVSVLADEAPGRFEVRPVGGAISLEGNMELRFPVWGDKLRGAAFVDFGQVWSEAMKLRPADLVWTPGAGLRYFSPIGPIRVDLGYNTQGTERLTVLTTKVCERPASGQPCDPASIVDDRDYPASQLENTRILTSLGSTNWKIGDGFFERLQIHFSIGQAF